METITQTYYIIEPEVAGSFGEKTQREVSVHPPKITKLHYIFDGWLGDDIVESFPVYLISEKLYELLKETELTGFEIDDCETEISETFATLQPDKTLPKFYWLKITGKTNRDDFWINEDNILTISESAYELIKQTNISNCDIDELKKEIPTT